MDRYTRLLLRSTLTLALSGYGTLILKAQDPEHIITTAAPSMTITPDARAAGMGDQGTGTSPDASAQYWNAAKYAFLQSPAGLSIGYTPWLSKIVKDVALLHAQGYWRIGGLNGRHSIGASLRYFSMGKVERYNALGYAIAEANPKEYALDLSYAYRFAHHWSTSIALRYLYSNLDAGDELNTGKSLMADLSVYMHRPTLLWGHETLWTAGLAIRNIGGKVSYTSGSEASFLPTILSLGTSIAPSLDKDNRLALGIELRKLLVPTPPDLPSSATDTERQAAREHYYKTSAIGGIFKSLTDAPGGLSEKLREIQYSLGAEYSYQERFFVRTGYSYLHRSKGNIQGITLGAGCQINAFRLDAAYMISTVRNNPLDQTFRCTLALDFDKLNNLFGK